VFKECNKAVASLGDGSKKLIFWDSSIDGIRMDLDDVSLSGLAKFACRDFELKHLKLLKTISFAPGDVVIDIGAHIGIPVIYLAKKYPNIRIYALEPHLGNYRVMNRNIIANRVSNIISFNLAVTSDGRKVKLFYPMSNSTMPSEFTDNAFSCEANSVSLEKFFEDNKIDRCKYLNINCEGAEHEIIMNNTSLFDRIEYVTGEIHMNGRLAVMGFGALRTYSALISHVKRENTSIVGLSGENGQLQDMVDEKILAISGGQ
jgi:FkbM family methyltransferase